MDRVVILDVEIDAIRSQAILQKVHHVVQSERKAVFAYANIHALNLAYEEVWFKRFLNSADVLYTDGEGVRLGAWLLGASIPERIALTTWVWELLGACADPGYRIYFLGSTSDVVGKAAENAQRRFPGLLVVGVHHGFFEKNGAISDMVIDKINAASPDVLLVGFGMPLQEEWIGENLDRICANAIFLVGSCFEYMAGAKSVCPEWISAAGFEWFYRMLQEPRRLYRRYMIGNPLFLLRVLRQRFSADESGER